MIKQAKRIWHAVWFISLLLGSNFANSTEFTANFKGTDINEFVNTVSKALNKTIIVDPSVRGTINVRSYDPLTGDEYYQFFLSVLDVYGYAVISMDNGVLKVIRAKDAKTSAAKIADTDNPGIGDEIVTRVVPLQNVTARELAPLLRQLIDSGGSGNVAHYEPSNVILLTGRAAVVNRLLRIIQKVDQAGDQNVETYKLKYAAASEVVKLVTVMLKEEGKNAGLKLPRLVADERTNSVMISGDGKSRLQVISMLKKLDVKQDSQGNTKVIYLKHAKAENLMNILSGMTSGLQNEKGKADSAPSVGLLKNVTIKADEQTNALIINATPDLMRELEDIITSLDIRRSQVRVEAIIAEIYDADGINLGIQWGHKQNGFTQFTDTTLPISTIDKGIWTSTQKGDSNLANYSGMVAGVFSGNWRALLTALSNNSKNDILATPSIVTLDNKEATFSVGQEVPVLTGDRTSTSSDNIYRTIERKSVGIKLKVTPQINAGGSVLLEIEQEVSSVGDSTNSLGATFNTRNVQNAVLVNSGETVVIGGLLDTTDKETVNKVPVFGDIPLLGYLFRSKQVTKTKRNLMVFIRPTILSEQSEYTNISEQLYEDFRENQQKSKDKNSPWEYPRSDSLVLPEYKRNNWTFANVKNAIDDFNRNSMQ